MSAVLQEMPAGVAEGLLAEALVDLRGDIVAHNARFGEVFEGGLLDRPFEGLFDVEQRTEVRELLRRVALGHPHHVAWPTRTGGGHLRHCEWHLRPRYRRGGRVAGLDAVVVPVEAQRSEWRRLYEAEVRFRQIASGVATMVWVAGVDGHVRAANRAWQEFVGEETVGDPDVWLRLVHPEHHGSLQERLHPAVGDEPLVWSYRLRRRDGVYRWVEERVLRQEGEQGEQLVVGSCIDVTEEREIRARLEQQVALTEGILNSALDAIVTVDEHQRIVGFNPAAEHMFGRTAEEMRGQPVTVLMPARFRPAHDGRVSGFLARGGHPSRVAAAPGICGLRPDGSEFPVELSVSSVSTPEGRRITAIIRDMTSYARALQALQDRESRLRLAMESANLGSAEVDLGTGHAVANAHAARVLGLGDDPAGWVLGDFTQPIHEDDRQLVMKVLEAIVREDRALDVEFRVRRRDDGTVRWIYARGRLYRDSAGNPRRVVGVVMDIDARKRAEEQLLLLSRRVLAAQEEERRGIARELHDQVGQALTAALINLQMLPPAPESAELHATLASVLQQVRELSLNLRPSMLDSLGLEAALSWYLDRQKALGGFEVELACPGPGQRLPPETETVVFRLVQEAVTNILRHARARRVGVVVEATAEEVVLSVRDDGVGFDAGTALARAERGGSLGVLGMAERAQLAGGTLRLESEPGRGTTVTAVLPLRR